MIIKGNTVGHPLSDPRRGLTMEGSIHMNGQPLRGLPQPAAEDEPATKKYADSLHRRFAVTLPASGWSDAAPHTQTVARDGIFAEDTPHYSAVYSADPDTALAEKEAFAMVDDLDTADGSVTFTCFEDKPEVNLNIQLEVNR